MALKALDTGRLASLDGMRGLAALGVVLIHGDEIFALGWVPYNAYLAVDFFFLLSGYVLARSFDRRLRQGWAIEFLRRRVLRLYPLIIAGSLLGFLMLCLRSVVAHSITMPQAVLDLVCSLLLIPTPPIFTAKWDIYPDDQPLWSLFCEMAANILYAFIAPALSNRRLAVLIGLAGLALGGAIVIMKNADFALDHFELAGLRVLFSFFLGVGMFRFLDVRRPAWRLPSGVTGLTFAVLAIVLLAPIPPDGPFALIVIFGVFPVLLLLALFTNPVAWGFEVVFLFLGLVSYPVYAVHHPFFRLVSGLFFHSAPPAIRLAGMCASLAGVIGFAWLLARFYDEPVRRWLTPATPRAPEPYKLAEGVEAGL